MSAGCFDLVIKKIALGTTFGTEYQITGFLLSGHWLNPQRVYPIVGILMAVVSFLHVIFLIQPLFFTPFGDVTTRLFSPSSFYAVYRSFLRNYWLGMLGLAVGAIVTTGLSSFSVWLLFLHAWFESWLFSLRLSTYLRVENTCLPILIPPVGFTIVGLSVMMASDSPIVKAIVTLFPAFIADIGNLVISSLLFHRSRVEEAVGVDRTFGLAMWEHGYELLFVVMHFVIFYPQLGLACLMSTFHLSILLLVLFSINFLLLIDANRIRREVPLRETQFTTVP